MREPMGQETVRRRIGQATPEPRFNDETRSRRSFLDLRKSIRHMVLHRWTTMSIAHRLFGDGWRPECFCNRLRSLCCDKRSVNAALSEHQARSFTRYPVAPHHIIEPISFHRAISCLHERYPHANIASEIRAAQIPGSSGSASKVVKLGAERSHTRTSPGSSFFPHPRPVSSDSHQASFGVHTCRRCSSE